MTYGMFCHMEHHLYPRVPTRKLPVLAQRLDKVSVEVSSRKVF